MFIATLVLLTNGKRGSATNNIDNRVVESALPVTVDDKNIELITTIDTTTALIRTNNISLMNVILPINPNDTITPNIITINDAAICIVNTAANFDA